MRIETIERMHPSHIHQLMLDAFKGQKFLIKQGKYIVIRVSLWVYYIDSVTKESAT